MSLPLSVFIVAHNEAERIGRTIESIGNLSDDIVVVDSGSTDGTREIARALGARVVVHEWEGYGPQKRFAETLCQHDWVFNLDADEVVTPALNREIHTLLSDPSRLTDGAWSVRIADVIPGDSKPRLFSYAHKYVRLYHKKAGSFAASPVHDEVVVGRAFETRSLKGKIHHFSIVNHARQIEKYNKYTDAQVKDMLERGVTKHSFRMLVEFPASFLKAYILRRHFMRGYYGYVTAINYAFFRHLRMAKYFERQRKVSRER